MILIQHMMGLIGMMDRRGWDGVRPVVLQVATIVSVQCFQVVENTDARALSWIILICMMGYKL